jgi:hypothetical protein
MSAGVYRDGGGVLLTIHDGHRYYEAVERASRALLVLDVAKRVMATGQDWTGVQNAVEGSLRMAEALVAEWESRYK